MVATTAAGTTISISAGVPATQDVAGYAALTYTEIGDIESIGTFGASVNKIEFQPLKGAKQKFKGSTDYGSLQPKLAHNKADAGQTLLRTAGDPDNNALFAYKVVLPSGDKRYFQGRVFGYPESIDGADSVVMANPTIEISVKVIKDDS
jgi:hypothetical protein